MKPTSFLTSCAAAVAAVASHAAANPGGAPSLPKINGMLEVTGLAAPVTVARDLRDSVAVAGESFLDVVRAQGFVHAQDRFFQMDATRRLAAGELSEIVGSAMLEMDRRYRRYRFRAHAQGVVEGLAEHERALLRAYAEGVNAGLASMVESGGAPPEYGLLNVQPQPWREEDSILAILAMFDMLHMEQHVEKRLGVMRDALPEELFEFLTPIATRFDAPLIVDDGNPHDWTPMEIPGPDVIDLRGMSAADIPHDLVQVMDLAPGSNNWAVAGPRSAHGGAILANDPHLQLTVPGIWYRVQLRWSETSKRQNVTNEVPSTSKDSAPRPELSTARRLGGISLPGLPGIVIGSSDHIAWGFTNTMGDFQDLIIVEVHPDDRNLYRTPDGYEPFEEVVETINVRGRPAETLTLRKTRWGIVTDTDHRGRPLVLKWTALEPDTIDLGMLDMLHARTIEEAVEVARRWAGPSQNILIACREGRIAWVVSGYLPDRFGPPKYDGRYPVSWADGDKGWRGPIPEEERPVIIDPEDGVLFTANNRTVGIERARRLGGIWTAGERASRIGELLSRNRQFDENDLFEMQLDTRVRLFDFYRDLALEAMNGGGGGGGGGGLRGELFDEAKEIIEKWNGRADADQPAMRLLDSFRRLLHTRVIAPLVAPCRETHAGFHYSWFMEEEPVRRILEERPAHLLPPGYSSWEQLIERAWSHTIQASAAHAENRLRTTWGEWNASSIEHPITRAMPAFGRTLNMPQTPQPGHGFAVRVAGPSFGASARLVVSPGREEKGILHTPTGQSGHFQSPHYRDLHKYWANGEALPFLPGEPVAKLTLVPSK